MGIMPGFHHSVAVLPLPFRRSAVVKFRYSYGNGETATENGNGMVETGHKTDRRAAAYRRRPLSRGTNHRWR